MAPNYRVITIPNGRKGIQVTLRLMSDLTRKYKTNPAIRELAVALTSDLSQKNYPGEITRIHNFVRDKIRYVKDVRGVETLQTPVKTLELRSGDCDDKSTLSASLLESLGHITRFVAVGPAPGLLTHVMTQVKLGPKWVNLETTENVPCGWYPPQVGDLMYHYN